MSGKCVHRFEDSLRKSHAAEDLPFWEECYRKAFHPHFATMTNHREDGEWQRSGIDRSVTLKNAKQYLIDEKVRWKDYGDVLLEFLSNAQSGSPGWVCKPLRADFIAYAIAPRGLCLLLPVIQLQQAWLARGDEWRASYKICDSENEGYTTRSVAVPINVLFPEIGKALRVTFTPVAKIEAA